jgi:hypothetical protein
MLTASATALLDPPQCASPVSSTGANATLPTGYNTGSYSFASILFVTTTAPTTKFVVTYVHDTDANNFLQLPESGGAMIGFTPAMLSGQFKRAAPKDLLYGGVTAGPAPYNTLNVWINGNNGVATLTYTVPAAVPAGAFALISAAQ